jgi:hypothetical protein
MKISKIFKQHFLIFNAFVFLAFSLLISNKINRPTLFITKQDSSLNVNTQLTQIFHLGQKRLISSLLWIATILESDHDHYKKKDLNSWMYLRFKSISDLEPRFYENYIFGGTYLSIIKDDLTGASLIYEKGLKEYPDDFDLLKNAAFHFHFEVGDRDKAYEIYSRLKNHPRVTPSMLSTLARLESQSGNLEVAFELLKGQYERLADKNSLIAVAIKKHLYAIKAEIDLTCLNTQKTSCAKSDLDNMNYMYNGKEFIAEKSWIPFRPKEKK